MGRSKRQISSAVLTVALAAILLSFNIAFPFLALADEGDVSNLGCEPGAVLAKAQETPDMADKLMSRTVEGIIRRIECDLPKKVMDDIRKDPASAEVILREKAPDCYEKMKQAYAAKIEKGLSIVELSVADALEMQMQEMGCPDERDNIENLIKREYRFRVWSGNYLNCVQALHQIRAAEESYKIDSGEYTADIGDIASFLVPGGDAVTPEAAEAAMGKACCSVPSCDPANNQQDAWNGDFGLDLSEDDGYLIYGYPIGGPDCLIMVSPTKDDPENFASCYEESEDSAKKSGADEEKQ